MLYKMILFLISLFSCKRDILKAPNIKKKDQESICFTPIPVNPPVFSGGLKEWKKYLERNIEYPLQAQKQKIEGVIQVQMVIDSIGNIVEVKTINNFGGGLAEEAERVIKKSPKWKPASQKGKNGRKISYRFIQSVTFKL